MTSNFSSQELADAFTAFNQHSLQLEQSYRELELRAAQLNEELAAARSERLQQLAEKEALADRLQTLIETMPAGVLVLDAVERVSECNRVAIEQLGGPLLGEQWSVISTRAFCAHDSYGAEIALHGGRRLNIASCTFDSAPGRILVLQDVTNTHALQERFNRQQRLSAMGEMAASLAHQIRTPLSAAVLYSAHLAKDYLPAGDRTRFAGRLTDRLGHLERLVNDMLTFARGGRGGDAQFTVRTLIAALYQAIEPQLQAASAGWQVIDTIPNALLLGNQDALIGALSNLVNNSLQAIPRGAELELRSGLSDSGEITLHLRDNGPGIPAEARARIFDPFFTTRPGGTGLGLAVVQATLRAHHGSIHLQTPAQGGCEFVLCLPSALSVVELPSGECLNYLTTAVAARAAACGIN